MKPVNEVSAAYARVILQSGAVSPGHLLEGVDLTPEKLLATEFIASSDLRLIYGNYDRMANDRTWTARLGAQLSIGAHGPLGFAALSAPTLGAALDVIADLVACRNSTMQSETKAEGSHYLFIAQETGGDAHYAQWMIEVVFKIIEELMASVLGHPVSTNVEISFAHSPPAQAQALCDMYDSRVVFDGDANAIAIPLAWRSLPSPLHDESLYRANIVKCREVIDARNRSASVSGKVRNRLSKHFDQEMLREAPATAPPTQSAIARSLHTSERSLIRHLKLEKESYRSILEELRRDYAELMLRDARLTVADIAEMLGYREAANFGRAFRRWHGVSPGEWRRI